MLAQRVPTGFTEPSDKVQELQNHIDTLISGEPSVQILQKLALFCLENPSAGSSSPPSPAIGHPGSPSPFTATSRSLPSLYSDIWDTNKNFERLFNALMQFLEPTRVRFFNIQGMSQTLTVIFRVKKK